jgi:uncharacterized protein YkwD
MLGYVNSLRTSVLGAGNELYVDSSLQAIAEQRAQELISDYSHNGARTDGENIAHGSSTSGSVVYNYYNSWYNSSGHYQNMVLKGYTRFGFAIAVVNGHTYAVQVFGW